MGTQPASPELKNIMAKTELVMEVGCKSFEKNNNERVANSLKKNNNERVENSLGKFKDH